MGFPFCSYNNKDLLRQMMAIQHCCIPACYRALWLAINLYWAIVDNEVNVGMSVACQLLSFNVSNNSRIVAKHQNRFRHCCLAIHHTRKGLGFIGLVG